MFVFPLGLQAKTRDFPWVTVAILVATCVYSVANFDATHAYSTAAVNAPLAIERLQKQKSLILASCKALKFSSAECSFLKRELRPERRETEVQLRLRLAGFGERTKELSKQRRSEILGFLTKPGLLLKAAAGLREIPEFEEFQSVVREEIRASAKQAREQSLLTRASFDLKSLLRATFLHAGWMHLFGNMLFFLMFAIPLESRVGAVAFSLIYLIGGGAGLTLDLFMSTESTRPLLGASASVSAVAAAFMVAFWSFSVRVFVSLLFVFNQIVLIPAWMFFAFFVVMHDLVGAFSLQGGNVAHVAHLGGFALGAMLGAIATQVRRIPKPFAFPFELGLFLKSRDSDNIDARVGLLRKILFHNSYNHVALKEAWAVIDRKTNLYWTEMPREARGFLNSHFCEVIEYLKNGEEGELRNFLARTKNAQWPWAELVPEAGIFRMMSFIPELQAAGRSEEVLGIARILATAYPNSDEAQALHLIEKRLMKHKTRGEGPDVGDRRTGS